MSQLARVLMSEHPTTCPFCDAPARKNCGRAYYAFMCGTQKWMEPDYVRSWGCRRIEELLYIELTKLEP